MTFRLVKLGSLLTFHTFDWQTACIWSMDDFVKLEHGVEKIQDAVLNGVDDNVTGNKPSFIFMFLVR